MTQNFQLRAASAPLPFLAAVPTLLCAALAPALAAQQDPDPRGSSAPAAHQPATPLGHLQDPDELAGPQRGPTSGGDPTPLTATRQITRIHTARADQGVEYGIWGAGADYKASFHNGMTFVPYLGKQYPHNQPFSWSTQSVKVGSTELVTQRPAPNQGDTRFEYDLGNVTEAYDLRVEGLEQTFVIHKSQGRGDLVVRGKVDSMLTAAAVRAAHQALSFVDAEGTPIVSYGEAFVVDADGRKVPMTTAYANGLITLSLAAAALEQLKYPIVVDPLLGNTTLRFGTGAPVNDDMDCLREDEGTSNNVWFTYSRSVSAVDDDLWIWRTGDQWSGADVAAFSDITSSWNAFAPQIASVGGANRTIAVFTRYFPLSATRAVRFHTHDRSDLTENSSYGSLPSLGGQVWRPDVGGTAAFTNGTTAMVVVQRDAVGVFSNTTSSDVYSIPIDVDSALGQGAVGTPVALVSSVNSDHERPRINQICGDGVQPVWIVALQTFNNGIPGDDWDSGVTAVDITGNQVAPTSYSETGSPTHKVGPIVAGQDGNYSVIYATLPIGSDPRPTNTRGFDLRVRRLTLSGNSLTWGNNLSSLSELGFTTASRRWEPRGLAYDSVSDNHWLASFHSSSSNTAYCALTGYRGGYVTRETVFTSTTQVFAGGVAFNDDQVDFLVMAGHRNNGSEPVLGDVFEYTTAIAESMSGVSCSPVTIEWSAAGQRAKHQHQIGNGDCELRASGAPVNAIHFMVLSLASRNTPVVAPGVAPGCRLLVQASGPDYIGILDFKVGANVSWDLALPEYLNSDRIYFQDWHTDNTGSVFLSSRRMVLTITQ